jgi:hypothetical protein
MIMPLNRVQQTDHAYLYQIIDLHAGRQFPDHAKRYAFNDWRIFKNVPLH